MQAAIEIQKGIKVLNPYPTESKYFSNSNIPYVDLAEAIAQIPTALRHVGLTVNVANVEYWWKFGTSDAELIAKSTLTIEQVLENDTIAGLGEDITDLQSGKQPTTGLSGTNLLNLIYAAL